MGIATLLLGLGLVAGLRAEVPVVAVGLDGCVRSGREPAYPEGSFEVFGRAVAPDLGEDRYAVSVVAFSGATRQAGPTERRTARVGGDGSFAVRFPDPPPKSFEVVLSRLVPVAEAGIETGPLERRLWSSEFSEPDPGWLGGGPTRSGGKDLVAARLTGPMPRFGRGGRSLYQLEGILSAEVYEAGVGAAGVLVPGTTYFVRSPTLLVVGRPSGGLPDPEAPYLGFTHPGGGFFLPIHGPPAPRFRISAFAMEYAAHRMVPFDSLIR